MEIEEIYKLYFKDVYTFLYSLTGNKVLAEDITQDTFLKALENIHRFDGRKDIRAWLFTIARNTYYTDFNRQKIYSPYEMNENTADNTDLLDHLILKEESTSILNILQDLKEPYKEVFMLRYFGDLSFKRISLMYSKTESWARVTFYRAKKEIKELMEVNDNE